MMSKYSIYMSKYSIYMARKLRGYLANRDGASAIEFAILFLPFIMLVFAILELAIVFFITATMTHHGSVPDG